MRSTLRWHLVRKIKRRRVGSHTPEPEKYLSLPALKRPNERRCMTIARSNLALITNQCGKEVHRTKKLGKLLRLVKPLIDELCK